MWQIDIPEGAVALGYKKLVELFNLKTLSHFRWSYASPKWEKRVLHFKDQNLTLYIYPPSYRLSDNVFEQVLTQSLSFRGGSSELFVSYIYFFSFHFILNNVTYKMLFIEKACYLTVYWVRRKSFYGKRLGRTGVY